MKDCLKDFPLCVPQDSTDLVGSSPVPAIGIYIQLTEPAMVVRAFNLSKDEEIFFVSSRPSLVYRELKPARAKE